MADDRRRADRASSEQLAAQLDELHVGDPAEAHDENFADSGQVAAEQGESMVLAGKLREQLDDVQRALDKLDAGTYGRVRGLRRADRRRSPRGHAGHPVLHRPRRLTWRGCRAPHQALLRVAATRRSAVVPSVAWVNAQLLDGEVELWRADERSRPPPLGGGGAAGRAQPRATRPPRPVLAAALLHDVGKTQSGLGHLRPGHRHRVGGGGGPRSRHDQELDPDARASPAASASTCSTPSSAATCSAWPAATR